MKKKSFLLLGISLFLLGCGGGGGSVSAIVDPVTDEATASDAVASAPWSAETVVASNTAQKTTANSNIYQTLSSVISSAQAGKKGKTTTKNIDKSVAGINGGTAEVSGTVEVESPPVATFPLETTYDLNVNFDGYVGTGFSLHGESTYTGTTNVTSTTNIESTFSSHGGYSYKDSTGVYSFATEMDIHLTIIDNVISGTYTFVVNGETINGSF